jgi:hypothetical protein
MPSLNSLCILLHHLDNKGFMESVTVVNAILRAYGGVEI